MCSVQRGLHINYIHIIKILMYVQTIFIFSKRIRYSLYIFINTHIISWILIFFIILWFIQIRYNGSSLPATILLFFNFLHLFLFFYFYNHSSLLQNCLVRSSYILSSSGLLLFLFILSTWKSFAFFLWKVIDTV